MRMSKLFSQTIREIPSEADTISYQLLLRAGFIRQLSVGIFTYLPLAKRSLSKIKNIIRQEINAIGGQEITMPVVHPAGFWQESGRWYKIGDDIGRFKDKNQHDILPSRTYEEAIAALVRKEIRSYRQLPQLLYHIQTKWRDDSRPRAGLIRAREFTMKDGYSLDVDWNGFEKQYNAHHNAYEEIFHRCGLPVIAIKSNTGIMGEQIAHEFMYLTPIGEDTIIICDHCGYSANKQIAIVNKVPFPDEYLLPIEKVATPNSKTIVELATFLSIPTTRTAKAVFLTGTFKEGDRRIERFIFAIVRGDMDISETKLANAIQAVELRPATDAEILAVGAVPGYASPVGVNGGLTIVDELIPMSTNLVAGANIEGYHLRNVNYERDYSADLIADITSARDGDECGICAHPIRSVRGVEVGNIYKLGTHFSDSMGCNYLDNQGQSHPIVIGSYGIGVSRLLACIAEEHHDDLGLQWPISISPYHVHLVSLPYKTSQGQEDNSKLADILYEKFNENDMECLYDDREESPGVKFNDADLIGNPIRLTISERSIKNGGVEYKRRNAPEKIIIPYENIIPAMQAEIKHIGAIT